MKILCLIDFLGSGGAQRQLVTLAVGLKKRGHEIRFLIYHQQNNFFLSLLENADIPCEIMAPCHYLKRAWIVRRNVRQGWQDVVLAFLPAPSLYAEIANIPKQKWTLVVGERSADPSIKGFIGSLLRQFHRLADVVVCNSHTNRLMLASKFPFLRKKLCTIYNTVDGEVFHPLPGQKHDADPARKDEFRIVVAASYGKNKNMINVAKALLLLKNNIPHIRVDWFGALTSNPAPYNQARRFITDQGMDDTFRIHPAVKEIGDKFAQADAVGLFSYFEGLPNVVCEGLACGKPILMSNVCDAGNLVKDHINGFLCDPYSPVSIAEAMQRLAALTDVEKRQMGLASKKIADEMLSEDIVTNRYERILPRATQHGQVLDECNWPNEIPETALRTVARWSDNGVPDAGSNAIESSHLK